MCQSAISTLIVSGQSVVRNTKVAGHYSFCMVWLIQATVLMQRSNKL